MTRGVVTAALPMLFMSVLLLVLTMIKLPHDEKGLISASCGEVVFLAVK